MLAELSLASCKLAPLSERELSDGRTWLAVDQGPPEVAQANERAVKAALATRTGEARKIWSELTAKNARSAVPYVNWTRLERLQRGDFRLPYRRLCSDRSVPDDDLVGTFSTLLAAGRTQDAIEFGTQLHSCARAPEALLVSLGEVHAMRSEYRPALDALDAVLARNATHSRALYLSGLIYARAREFVRARRYLEASVAAGGSFSGLRTTLAHVYLELNLPDQTLEVLKTPDADADNDDVTELTIRATVLVDWRADTASLFGRFASEERRLALERELYGGGDLRLRRAAEHELTELY